MSTNYIRNRRQPEPDGTVMIHHSMGLLKLSLGPPPSPSPPRCCSALLCPAAWRARAAQTAGRCCTAAVTATRYSRFSRSARPRAAAPRCWWAPRWGFSSGCGSRPWRAATARRTARGSVASRSRTYLWTAAHWARRCCARRAPCWRPTGAALWGARLAAAVAPSPRLRPPWLRVPGRRARRRTGHRLRPLPARGRRRPPGRWWAPMRRCACCPWRPTFSITPPRSARWPLRLATCASCWRLSSTWRTRCSCPRRRSCCRASPSWRRA
mmetsp:Transcript_11302/g.28514  ORF Transcript_11302/g.28514 Transcript_11302/m.28514 type:complete len:268 (+) Transcript_11302:156-959(+)